MKTFYVLQNVGLYFLLAAATLLLALQAKAAHTVSPVVVSLTFDDTFVDYMLVREAMDRYGYKGTFYVNSSRIGQRSKYFSLADLQTLAVAGHEIGGHTLDHVSLPGRTDQQTQICDDRRNLKEMGFNPVSFAYPKGDHDDTSESLVSECGYNSARAVTGIKTGRAPYAETIPPQNRYAIRSFGSIEDTTDVDSMLNRIDTAAANGGGWLLYIFHDICPDSNPNCVKCPDSHPNCKKYSITVSNFITFVDGLYRRRNNVEVKTVQQVMSLANPSLEVDANGELSRTAR